MKLQIGFPAVFAVTYILCSPVLAMAQRGGFKAPTIYALKQQSAPGRESGNDSSGPVSAPRPVVTGRDSVRAIAGSYSSRPDANDSLLLQRQQAVRDSMAVLVQQYKLLMDSIRYYHNLSPAVSGGGQDSANAGVVYKRSVSPVDSVSRVQGVQRAPDSTVNKPKRWYQRIFYNPAKHRTADSVSAVRTDTVRIPADSTVKRKRRWYQRIFDRPQKNSGQADTIQRTSGNVMEVVPERSAPLYREEDDRKSAELEAQAARLQLQIDDLQRANDGLSSDYAQRIASRGNDRSHVTINPPAAVVYTTEHRSADEDEIKALRKEVQALKGQQNNNVVGSADPPGSAAADSLQQDRGIPDAGKTTTDSMALAELKKNLSRMNHRLDSLQAIERDSSDAASRGAPAGDLTNYPVVSVYFARNASILGDDQLERLRPVAAFALKNNANICLKAFTDGVGSREANLFVGIRRTEYVRSVLKDRYGMPSERLIIREPVLSAGKNAPKPDALLRRVELAVTL